MVSRADKPKILIDIDDVSFNYGYTTVLNRVSFSIHTGDFLALIGPNGSGKTTLLKVILGFLKPAQGVVRVFGSTINEFKSWYKIGYVPQKATHIDPGFADAWYGLGSSYQSIGDTQRAADCYKKVLSLVPDHAIARHLLASLSGNNTDSPEPIFVEQLFDHYAERYEQHLLGELQYKGHTLVASALRTFLQQQDQNRVLDLGCGTGLFGAEIAPLCSRLVGIDLSSEMIKHAKGRGCYEELRVIDLLKFMKQSPPSTYDIVASVDVFSYLGDLNPAFKAVHRILKSGGLFAFTVEAATGTEAAGYRLNKTGRYQHAKAYLNQLAKRYGYEDLSMVLSTLRSENRSACEAWVCIWRKCKIPVSND